MVITLLTWIDETKSAAAMRSCVVETGMKDGKGRWVGYFATLWKRANVSPNEEQYEVRVHATRNGSPFGALRKSTTYLTLSGAKAAAETKIDQAIKRAHKRADFVDALGGGLP